MRRRNSGPFGYGSKVIGPNGDVGWVEYLLFSTNPDHISRNPNFAAPGISQTLWEMVSEYVSAVREMACSVLEMIAEELEMTNGRFPSVKHRVLAAPFKFHPTSARAPSYSSVFSFVLIAKVIFASFLLLCSWPSTTLPALAGT
ncbi:gibberellin 2-beta-dioxygenase 2-like [Salvia miltiorrhiza]|uniref:gibberellin 2-beta-dioxygenase 2-like n=1 Tax=Salvia miltiorrhiza TaxID=226208 RepID=UPI0025AD8596|nr:gibberellin 2-beta-dioxygenase 2-like [Salvia miltiorrhiza]